jgi:hypothetical protein
MKWSGVMAMVVLAMTAGCSADHGTPAASSSSGAAAQGGYGCGEVSVDRWAATDPRSADEPTVRMPQPPDWKRVTGMDSDLVRLILRDDSVGGQLSPSIVVTITDATGRAQTPQAVIDTERNNVTISGATGIADTPGAVCGFQAGTFAYTSAQGAAAARSVKTVVVAPQYNNKLFDIAITVQDGDSPNPTYARDAQTILAGMQIKVPSQP